MPDIGDGPCGRCGGNNPVIWFASPNERWNEVYGSAAGTRCPNCFFAEVVEAGYDNHCWAFIPEDEKELAWQSRWEHGRRVGRDEAAARLTEAETRASTMREALQRIAAHPRTHDRIACGSPGPMSCMETVEAIARAALATAASTTPEEEGEGA